MSGRPNGRGSNGNGQGGGGRGGNRGGRGTNGNNGGLSGAMAGMNIQGGGDIERKPRPDFYDLVSTRPQSCVSKLGAGGTNVKLYTNYFRFKERMVYRFCLYRLEFSPTLDLTARKKEVVRRKKKDLPTNICDGDQMWSYHPIYPHQQMNSKQFSSSYTNRDTQEEIPVTFTVKLVGEVHPTDHHTLSIMNLILKQSLEKLNLITLNRQIFDAQEASHVREYNIEVWPGYQTSIRQHEDEILLNVEITNKLIRTDSVYDQFVTIGKMIRGGNYEAEIKKKLLGAIVMTKYNKKTYRVDDIDFKANPASTFPKNGKNVSYAEYYLTNYQIKIKDMKQPLLVSRPKDKDIRGGRGSEPIRLIPELCNMTGLTDQQRSDFQLMKALSEHTRVRPTPRVQALNKFIRRIASNKDATASLAQWNVAFAPDLVQLDGRVMDQEKVHVGGLNGQGNVVLAKYDQKRCDWSRSFSDGFGMECPAPIEKWLIIYPRRLYDQIDAFANKMNQVSRNLGIIMKPPRWVEIDSDRSGDYADALKKSLAMKPNMVMVAIPKNDTQLYATIKKLCYLNPEHPTPCQVVTGKNMNPTSAKFTSIATKLTIQVSTKLGGSPWSVSVPIKDTMVCGFDTYHEGAQAGGKSFGALVASYNASWTRYFSTVRKHEARQEVADCIPLMMVEAVKNYQEKNGKKPERIVFYRDGVGEGQLQLVCENEVKGIIRVFNEECGYDPKFCFIVVSKRINTRFFAKYGNEFANPTPGTVIDSVVTLPERYDFFLVSQSVGQGTVNPTSFNVIHDKSGLQPKHLQMLSFKLTHLYYNWPGTVRVPAPCQYAHKLAYLVGESLRDEPNRMLNNNLYYL